MNVIEKINFKILITIGVLLTFFSILILISYYGWFFEGRSSWKINVTGVEKSEAKRIQTMLHFLLHSEPMDEDDLKQVLEMDPKIQNSNISMIGRQIDIIIKPRKTTHLVHSKKIEQWSNDILIQDNLIKWETKPFPEILIFHLTEQNDSVGKLKRDIIRLWQKSWKHYGFLWKRISEIAFLYEDGDLSTIIYPVNVQVKIRTDLPWSEEMLSRLWGVLFFLEKNPPNQWNEVTMNRKNAVMKQMDNHNGE